jgi:aryl-alcohol dehydrogenase-like predicted oxidoreductase
MRYLSQETTKRISRIGLGTWQFGSREWGYGPSYAAQEAQAIVRRAVELGVTLFDTAEVYGFGRSERILGEALGEDREPVFLATKIFPCCRSPRSSSSARWPARTGSASAGSTCTRCTSPIR